MPFSGRHGGQSDGGIIADGGERLKAHVAALDRPLVVLLPAIKALHLICGRDDGLHLNNLIAADKAAQRFRSGQWYMPEDDALYLHAAKSTRSEFGGVVLGVEPVTENLSGACSAHRVHRADAITGHRPAVAGQEAHYDAGFTLRLILDVSIKATAEFDTEQNSVTRNPCLTTCQTDLQIKHGTGRKSMLVSRIALVAVLTLCWIVTSQASLIQGTYSASVRRYVETDGTLSEDTTFGVQTFAGTVAISYPTAVIIDETTTISGQPYRLIDALGELALPFKTPFDAAQLALNNLGPTTSVSFARMRGQYYPVSSQTIGNAYETISGGETAFVSVFEPTIGAPVQRQFIRTVNFGNGYMFRTVPDQFTASPEDLFASLLLSGTFNFNDSALNLVSQGGQTLSLNEVDYSGMLRFTSVTIVGEPQGVPEPRSLALLAVPLLAVLVLARGATSAAVHKLFTG